MKHDSVTQPSRIATDAKRAAFTHGEWMAEGARLFGADMRQWKFVCPSCGHVTSVQNWQDAGAPETVVAFSCVGRYRKGGASEIFKAPGPCNYAGGGLFRLNPVTVTFDDGKTLDVFAFAAVQSPKAEPQALGGAQGGPK